MFGLLVLLFTVIPAIEIYLLINIGGQIGGFNTLLIVIITGIVGAALAKSQGLLILTKIQNDLQKGQLPADQITQGLLVFAGGILLLTPGFLTDFLGLSMVFPGTRMLIMIFAKKHFEKMLKSGNIQFYSFNNTNSYQNNDTFDADFSEHSQSNNDNIIEVDFNKNEEK